MNFITGVELFNRSNDHFRCCAINVRKSITQQFIYYYLMFLLTGFTIRFSILCFVFAIRPAAADIVDRPLPFCLAPIAQQQSASTVLDTLLRTCSPVLSTACFSHMWLYLPHKSVPLIKPFWPNYSTCRLETKYSFRLNNNISQNNSYRVLPIHITLSSSYLAHIRIHLHQKLTHWKVRYQWNYSNFDGAKIQTTCSVDACANASFTRNYHKCWSLA